MPSVVPATTATSESNLRGEHRRSRPASCRPSPRGRRRPTVDAEHAPARRRRRPRPRRACRASAPRRRRRRTTARAASAATSAGTAPRTQLPTQPASAWLTSVATRMPATIGHGRGSARRASSARSWVLSPSSPRATTAVETRRASSMREVAATPPRYASVITVRGALRRPLAPGKAIIVAFAQEPTGRHDDPSAVVPRPPANPMPRTPSSSLAVAAALLACASARRAGQDRSTSRPSWSPSARRSCPGRRRPSRCDSRWRTAGTRTGRTPATPACRPRSRGRCRRA